MSEKIDIATELVLSSVANIVATLNAVELVHHTIHIKENSEIKMNLFMFLLKFEDNIFADSATSNKESTNVIVVLDKFASCDIAIGHI